MKNAFFPVYKDDGYTILSLNSNQRNAVQVLVSKIRSGKYSFEENSCQCGATSTHDDLIVTEKDMFGIPNVNLLCGNCGLIRSQKVLKENSLSNYYNIDYKPINYNLQDVGAKEYYESQKSRGKQFYELANKYAKPQKGQHIYDMGCGAGGVMHYFNEAGMKCFGNDFSKEYLAYGNSQGMKLAYGDMQANQDAEEDKFDFFILAHVYEHLVNPYQYLKEIFRKLRIGGILIMEVPGVYAESNLNNGYPLSGCQFAHVVNFYNQDFLTAMFEHFGTSVKYGDEHCTFIVQKTENTNFDSKFEYVPKDPQYLAKLKAHLALTSKKYKKITNPIYAKRKIAGIIKGKVY
ncbi:MAG: class I SAM-dependent methyltransferase [Flavobacteriales bacterium]|nr:class I SAM-dependent methyltransferase [Flavobacteriales bacterium]